MVPNFKSSGGEDATRGRAGTPALLRFVREVELTVLAAGKTSQNAEVTIQKWEKRRGSL